MMIFRAILALFAFASLVALYGVAPMIAWAGPGAFDIVDALMMQSILLVPAVLIGGPLLGLGTSVLAEATSALGEERQVAYAKNMLVSILANVGIFVSMTALALTVFAMSQGMTEVAIMSFFWTLGVLIHTGILLSISDRARFRAFRSDYQAA